MKKRAKVKMARVYTVTLDVVADSDEDNFSVERLIENALDADVILCDLLDVTNVRAIETGRQ